MDPSFWEDTEVSSLTRDERLFLLGCIQHGDDEGRLKAHPTYLKASIFMYDSDITETDAGKIRDSVLEKMAGWHESNIWRILLYGNQTSQYLCFPNWYEHQKPSHATPSRLPTPPPEALQSHSRGAPEPLQNSSREAHEELRPRSGEGRGGEVRSGQSSLGKVSIGRGDSRANIEFQEMTDGDLTDEGTLQKCLARALELGGMWPTELIVHFWTKHIGQETTGVFDGAHLAVARYPPDVLTRALLKCLKYGGGKRKTWKYMEKILQEESGEEASR